MLSLTEGIRQEFETIVEGLSDALDFSHTIGADAGPSAASYERGGGKGTLGEIDFYTRSDFPAFKSPIIPLTTMIVVMKA